MTAVLLLLPEIEYLLPSSGQKICFFHYCNTYKVEFGFATFPKKLVQTNVYTFVQS